MMATQQHSVQDRLSPKGLEELLRLLVSGQDQRVSSAVIDGNTVWIKRMGAEGRPLLKRLHAWISPLIPWVMLRSSEPLGPEGMAGREARKTSAFAKADFPAVRVLFQQGSNLVLSSASAIVQEELNRLKNIDAQAHEDLLVACAAALGKAHQAGLCHGRPHPRDMILEEERIGFLDFEEAPEDVMPLADAQARDLWLLFLQVSGQSQRLDTNRRAFDAYCIYAPSDVLPRLAAARGVFAVILPILRTLKLVGLGSDGKKLLKASDFLYSALSEAQTPITERRTPEDHSGQKPKAMQ